MAGTARRGRPRLTDEERAAQRSRILGAAMESIRERGAEVSLDDIAGDVGVSKPLIYSHFGDRLGLADAIAVVVADEVTAATVATVERRAAEGADIDFDSAVGAIVGSLVDLVEHDPAIYGFLVRTIRSGERGFYDNALVEVIRERGGRLVEFANPGIPPAARRVLVDGAFGFLLFAIESWKASRRPGRNEAIAMLTAAVVSGFDSAVVPPTS
ncbi:MAG: TetR/AcrR family transcriptional regulator [Microthrixaceae bacterium]|nr:TetR/AcrR family transcriptional regulator [Microthrixaceae bacterium]